MTQVAVSPKVSFSQSNPTLTLVNPDFISPLKERMEAFSGHLMVMKGCGKGTINNYRKLVSLMLRDLGTLDPSHAQVQQRVAKVYGQGYSYYHLTNVIRAAEAYMTFLGNPIKFGRPKKPKVIVKDALTEAEVSVIIAACRGIREKAMIALLAYTGLRNQELCDLRVRDIDMGHNLVHVLNGKGSKGRTVCMSGDCTQVLLQYLSIFPRTADDYLFTTIRQRAKYSTWALRRLVKRIVARTGCKKRVHPHLFRHSLASNMLARGANLLTIKEQLGHAFIETTMIYIRSRPQRVQSEYQMFTPSYI
ncbi:MAG: tyrosine-type recombinase/integrase [Desulfobacterales bacterium]|nr:tyrosine-type recombinase/integrase [Desulfobacterales bacterium]